MSISLAVVQVARARIWQDAPHVSREAKRFSLSRYLRNNTLSQTAQVLTPLARLMRGGRKVTVPDAPEMDRQRQTGHYRPGPCRRLQPASAPEHRPSRCPSAEAMIRYSSTDRPRSP